METSDTMDELIPALLEAQKEIETRVERNAEVDMKKFSYEYTTLDRLIEHVKPILNDHGIVFVQSDSISTEGRPVLTTTFFHESGQWMRSETLLMVNSNDPQDFGSACTYARRYALSSILGIASESDDDASTVNMSGKTRPKKKNRSKGNSQGGKMTNDAGTITEKQRKAIYAISQEKEFDNEGKTFSGDGLVDFVKHRNDVESLNDLSKAKASKVIDWLDGLSKKAEEATPDEILDEFNERGGETGETPF